MSIVATTPPRLVLINLATHEELEAAANPPLLTEARTAQWNRLAVPGLGYQPLQYRGTTNRQIAELELVFDARWHLDVDVDAARRFLDALVAPVDAQGASAPPHVLLVWPKLLTLEAVAESVELSHEHLAIDGSLVAMRAVLTFEAVAGLRAIKGGA